jgi:hypothetical protein
MKIYELIFCLIIAVWVLGKILYSIPRLYRNSRYKKGAMTYGSLSALAAYRVMVALIVLTALYWVGVLFKLSDLYLNQFSELAFASLFICGLIAFFILIITFIFAKANRFQRRVEGIDVLDAPNR